MFGKYLTGYIGMIIVLIGIVMAIYGLFAGNTVTFFWGLALTFGGGYLRYQSKQAVTVEKTVEESHLDKNKYVFKGEKNLDNESYHLYLVDKYKIKKNDTLEKYVLNNKPYADLQEALKIAHILELNK
tara:strand:+ start:419 stop:802 length:384 start_codon:yes stop_codon:yes gene_type:complete